MTIIRTRRFTIRPIEAADAPRWVELCSDIDIARNTARIPHPYTLEDAQGFIAYAEEAMASGAEHIFAVCRDGLAIACAGLTPHEGSACELGYWVGADYRGAGVATEAGDAMLQYACSVLKPQTLTSGYFTNNPASGKVLEKLGFKPTGEIKVMDSVGRGEKVDTVRLAMPAADYAPLQPADITQGP